MNPDSNLGALSWRELESFERLLSRQTVHDAQGLGGKLSIPHVCSAVVDGPIDPTVLASSLTRVIANHPLLRACIKGDGKVIEPAGPGLRIGGKEPDPLRWAPIDLPLQDITKALLDVVNVAGGEEALEEAWQSHFQGALDGTRINLSTGPLWKLTAFRGETKTVLVFAFNHGMSDQISTNNIIGELLSGLEDGVVPQPSQTPQPRRVPVSIENGILGDTTPTWNTLRYAIRQAFLGAVGGVLLPDELKKRRQLGQPSLLAKDRETRCEFRFLSEEVMEPLVKLCRQKGLTVTAALAAAMLITVSDFAHEEGDRGTYWYRFLLSLNMKAFFEKSVSLSVLAPWFSLCTSQ